MAIRRCQGLLSAAGLSLTLAAPLPSAIFAGESPQEIRKALVGLAAYAGCKERHAGYSAERAQRIISSGIANNGWQSQADWLRSPQALRVVALTTDAMNKSCDDFDQNSKDFVPAMQAIDAL
ncbi:hypothetical protein [Synechococcus sp. HK01-R]|uniref:hypothetical protein n=1 Tax=Synechococcus sp. HK01-R TaxID=2751171 RepID=UPI001624D1C8|nr:hypothetical protein [Synechococcus sp. HK01-R]QNG26315.1 hypothetical protein H0O21_08495 [Synechococcus sp. HK01-R]